MTNDAAKIKEFQTRMNEEMKKIQLLDDDILQHKYDAVSSCLISAAEPFRIFKPQEDVISKETKEIIQDRERLRLEMKNNPAIGSEFRETSKKVNLRHPARHSTT